MRNIIITGGGMVNKGAQAMTLIAVHELLERFPNHQIYLYSPVDMVDEGLDKGQFRFQFTGWYPLKFARCQRNPMLRAVTLLRNRAELLAAEAIYRHTEFIVDVSGYALGSNWSDKICNDFLDVLEFAQGFSIPVYLMPQSFGPFNFAGSRKSVDDRCRQLLPTVKRIFAREQEGYDALVSTYGLTNVQLAKDLVLCNRGVELANIFQELPVFDLPDIKPHSVGIIPNSRNSEVGSNDTVLALYDAIIEQISKQGRQVYLLSHSSVDAKLCSAIKARFVDDANVVLLEQDFSCLEFNELVKKLDFLIASRFHSIVHAFKNGVPCIALGWATKYHDLLKLFGQEQYIFDVRDQIDTKAVCAAIERMNCTHAEESARISAILAEVQQNNVFDVLSEIQKEL